MEEMMRKGSAPVQAELEITEITVGYRKTPLGLDEVPRFCWKLRSGEKDTMQTKYRVQVCDEAETVWDSGEVESDRSLFVTYAGEPLRACRRYEAKVRVWDNHGNSAEEKTWFETGLLPEGGRRDTEKPGAAETGVRESPEAPGTTGWGPARWITHDLPPEEACPVFWKRVSVRGAVRSARAYVTSLGVYELEVDGRKAGDAFFAPGWTSYHNRLQYQTYDITGLLAGGDDGSAPAGEISAGSRPLPDRGTHTVSITVGNGWYKGYLNCEGENCFYGDRTAVLALIRIVYEDGTVEEIGTGEDWSVTAGVIRSSEIYMGETQDLRLEEKESGQSGGAQKEEPAILYDPGEKISLIVSQQSEPVRVTKRFPVKEKIITPKGEIVLDFGQNMAGFVEVRLPGAAEDGEGNWPERSQGERKLRIFHGETLDKFGNFYNENLRTAKSVDTYVYTEQQEGEIVHPHFTYHGFRYVRLEGVSPDVDPACFTACALHTDMEQTGHFFTDHELINRLQKNIEWGQRSNFFDIPTDCPQRDERLGWTGDAQIFCRTGCFNFQSALFYKKWMRDVVAETDDAHGVPHIVPNIVGPATGTAVWSDCATVIPWTVYMVYGDEEILREQYDNMRQWVEYIRRSCGGQVLWMNGFQRGDWLALDSDESLHLMSGGTDKNLVANVYYAYSTRILRDAAKVLGKEQDAKAYGELYD